MKKTLTATIVVVLALLMVGTSPAFASASAYVKCTPTPTTVWADAKVILDNSSKLDAISYGWSADPDKIILKIVNPSGGIEHQQTLYPYLMSGSGAVFAYPNTNGIPSGSVVKFWNYKGGSSCFVSRSFSTIPA